MYVNIYIFNIYPSLLFPLFAKFCFIANHKHDGKFCKFVLFLSTWPSLLVVIMKDRSGRNERRQPALAPDNSDHLSDGKKEE